MLRLPLIASLLAACLLAPATRADDDPQAALKDAMALMSVTQMDAAVTQSMDQVLARLRAALASSAGIKDDALLTRIGAIIKEEFDRNKDGFYNEAAAVYSKHFTHDEIRQMIDFYRTPIGQKTIAVMPALLADISIISLKLQAQVNRGVAPRIDEAIREWSATQPARPM